MQKLSKNFGSVVDQQKHVFSLVNECLNFTQNFCLCERRCERTVTATRSWVVASNFQ